MKTSYVCHKFSSPRLHSLLSTRAPTPTTTSSIEVVVGVGARVLKLQIIRVFINILSNYLRRSSFKYAYKYLSIASLLMNTTLFLKDQVLAILSKQF